MTKLIPHARSGTMKLHERMQEYERRDRHYLTPKVPVIVRVDGRAFHTLTRGMDKPFDGPFMEAMVQAAEEVMRQATGGILAYVQSDEASFLFLDDAKQETMPWFDYRQDKLISLTASIMTMKFNEMLRIARPEGTHYPGATFDGRAFNIPREDVPNYFLHRAVDWMRNSIQMLARSRFSHKQLFRKSQGEMMTMLAKDGIRWYHLPGREKYGTFIYRTSVEKEMPGYSEPVTVRRLTRADYITPCYSSIMGIVEIAVEGYNVKKDD